MQRAERVARRLVGRPISEGLGGLDATLARLRAMDRYVPTTIELEGRTVQLVDGASAAAQIQDLFLRGAYDFSPSGPAPVIIDGGANIGLATLRWLELAPDAVIECFEPDPDVFAALTANVGHLPGVSLHAEALWREETSIPFTRFGADAGRVAELTDDRTTYNAQAVTLSGALRRLGHVDLLKIDIEGAEWHVLDEAKHELGRVDSMIIEHHSFLGQDQLLAELLQLLADAGMRVHVHNDNPAPKPLVDVPHWSEMDLQLNVFAWREPA